MAITNAKDNPQVVKSPDNVVKSPDSLAKVAELEKALLEKQKARGQAEEAIKVGKGNMVELAGNLVRLDGECKKLTDNINLVRFEQVQDNLLHDVLNLVAKYPALKITRLLYDATPIEKEGVVVTTPMVSINEHITRVGKRSSGKGGTKTMWHNKVSGEDKPAAEVFKSLNINGELAGTAKAGAWGRVLEALHKKGLATDWEAK